MELILAGLQWSHCLVYIDGMMITGMTFEACLLHLQEVFDRLLQAGLKLQTKKCHFPKQEVQYLGHLVSKDSISPDSVKIEKIASWPIPTCTKEVQQFLGLAGYYRRFIRFLQTCSTPPPRHRTELRLQKDI